MSGAVSAPPDLARSRGGALALALASLLISACSSGASPAAAPGTAASATSSPLAVIKLKVSQPVAALTFASVYVARFKGFFAEESLDVEQISSGGGGPDTQALITGDVQFNITPGTNHLDAFTQGKKLVAVYNAVNKNMINVVMRADVAKRLGITAQTPLADKLRALKGLTIAATRPGALTFQQAEAMVRRAGYEPQKDVKIVGAGEGMALIAALESGQADLFLTAVPVPETAVARGSAVMFINNAAGEDPSIIPFDMETVLVTQEYAQKNPDIVRRFVRAIRKASEWIAQASPEQFADALGPDFATTPRDVLVAGAASTKAATNRTGVIDRKGIQNLLEMTGSKVNADEFFALFDGSYLK
jgi:NitT/TauT family transport system substrate-binding protein